jgi:hypothetical protein|tara:strand:+ start:97 stop:1443 length:1347 start_codon:yes stop_codon:yes gene_type:complete
MALNNFIKEKYKKIPDLLNYLENAGRDKKFQRRACWTDYQVNAYEVSMNKNYNLNPIIVVNVEDSMNYCLNTAGKKDDYEYFQIHFRNGVTHLIVDGANRLDTLRLLYNRNSVLLKNKQHGYKELVCDRETMHEVYVANAMGQSPNRQEIRTGIFGVISDLIRDLSEKHSGWLLKMTTIDQRRMDDDAFISGLMTYISISEFGNDDGVDNFYRLDNFKDVKKLKYILKNIKRFDNTLRKTYTNKILKTYMMGLVIVFAKIYDNDWVLFNKKSFKKFVINYHTWWETNYADTHTYIYNGKDKNTFKELLGGLSKGKKQLCLMDNHFNDYVNSLVSNDIYQPNVSEDLATKEQRTKLIEEKRDGDFVWVRQNGMVDGQMIFGNLEEFVKVSYLEVLNTDTYQVDHIYPKTLSGATEISNMEITTKKYNGMKSDGIPNYTKLNIREIIESN